MKRNIFSGRISLWACLPVIFVLSGYICGAQTLTINTTAIGAVTNGQVIVFAIQNNNTDPVDIKSISLPRRTSHSANAVFNLWYRDNGAMNGAPGTIATPDWTQAVSHTVAIATNGTQEVIPDAGVRIPPNTMFRFALHVTGTGTIFTYPNSGSRLANSVSNNNVTLYTGNHATSPGYLGTFPTPTTANIYLGAVITFEIVATPCVDPVISAVSADDPVVCPGNGTTLRVTGDLNDATAWHWYTGSCGGTPVGTGASINVTPGTATNYYVRGEGGCVTPGACEDVRVETAALPALVPAPADISCHGAGDGAVSLGVSGGAGTFSYSWTGPGSYTSTSKDIAGLAPGTYEVTVTTTPGGCPVVADAVVNEPSAVTASASSNSPLCAGSTLNLSGSGSGGTGTLSYSWTGPGYTSSVQNPSVAPGAAGAYTLTVTDANSCSESATTNVTINSSTPASTPVPAATDMVLCSGSSTVLSISSGNLNDATGWHWYAGSCGGTPVGTGASLTVTPGTTTTYYVRGEGGCPPAGSCGSITITVAAAPALKAVPADISCHGAGDGAVSLGVSGGTGTFSYSWTGPGSYTSTSKDITGLAPGAYEVTVTTTSGGCPAVADAVVNEPSAVTASASSNSPLCAGNTLNLSGSGSGGTGTLSYSWTGPGYTSSVQNPSVSSVAPGAAGAYTLTVTDANSCSESATTNVTINSSTPASVPVLSVSATTICPGDTATLGIVSGSLNAATDWHWYSGSCGGTLVGTGSSIRVSPAATTSYYVRGEGGCATSAACANTTVTIGVHVTPGVQISANTGLTICAGTSVTYTAIPVNEGAAPVYKWKKNGLSVGSNSTSYTDNGLNHGDVITCVLISNQLCALPDSAISNTLTMHVDPVVTPSVTISAAPGDTICSGTPVTFTATPVHGGVAPVYQWKKNGNNEGSNSPVYTDNALNDNDIISCEMTSNAICPVTPTVSGNSITMEVTVVPDATITASGSTIICERDEVLLSADESGFVYQWRRNGTSIPGATAQDYPASEAGSYTVEVVNGNCSATTAVPVAISTLPLPGPIVIVTGDTLVTLLTYDAYQWHLNGNLVPGATNRQHIAQESGVYRVIATDSNGCAGISAFYTVTVGGLGAGTSPAIELPVTVYPNPAAGTLYIDAPYPVRVALYSMDGRLVARQDDARVMNIDYLKAGLYMVQITDHRQITIKVEKLLKLE